MNYAMLQKIQDQIGEMHKLRESQISLRSPRLMDSNEMSGENNCFKFLIFSSVGNVWNCRAMNKI